MLGVPSVPDVGAVPRGGRPVPAGTAVLRGFLLASAGLGVHGWGVVGERAGGFGDQTGGGGARGGVRSVDAGVAGVGPAQSGSAWSKGMMWSRSAFSAGVVQPGKTHVPSRPRQKRATASDGL